MEVLRGRDLTGRRGRPDSTPQSPEQLSPAREAASLRAQSQRSLLIHSPGNWRVQWLDRPSAHTWNQACSSKTEPTPGAYGSPIVRDGEKSAAIELVNRTRRKTLADTSTHETVCVMIRRGPDEHERVSKTSGQLLRVPCERNKKSTVLKRHTEREREMKADHHRVAVR